MAKAKINYQNHKVLPNFPQGRTSNNKLAQKLSWLAAVILVLIPFHAFLTVWLASGTGHYISVRLWKEVLLLIITAGCAYLLIKENKLRAKFFKHTITRLIGAYFFLTLAWGFVAYGLHKVTLKALGYGLVVNLRFLVFFLAVWIIASLAPNLKKIWPKLLLIPAAAVVVIGLLQRVVLPYDVLKHFGYGSQTIFPYETINHNIHYPRIMSTLRGANPLGAYLVIILSAASLFFIKFKKHRMRWGIFGLVGLLALFFSYSRGAWVGLAASLALLSWVSLKNGKARKMLVVALALILVVGATAALGLRHNPTFENYFLHTQKNSKVAESSNQGHVSAFRSGVHDVLHQPLGQGVGTAGPASVYNNNQTRVSENYFIQIAQEVGWLGLILFLAINFLVGRELWLRRSDTLSLALLGSLIGLTFVNLLSHAWTDDTLAYLWWGLAGVAIATPAVISKK